MTDLVLGRPELVHLLWAAALAAAAGAVGIARRRRALAAFAALRLLPVLTAPVGLARPLTRLALLCASLTALVVAAADPRWGQAEQKVVTRGVDIMVLLDVSRSMLARDIAPNRLERAKVALADDLLPRLGGDRVGIVTFAGVASLKCPLTSDYGFVRLVLDEISTTSSPRGGTLIGDALRRAAEAFGPPGDNERLVILITDGEDHDSYPVEAAAELWEKHKIPVVAIGLGDPTEGGRIPIGSGKGEKYLEHDGKTVWSRADFAQLKRIAEASDLKAFLPVGTRDFDLGAIYRDRILPALKYKEKTAAEKVERPSQYHAFAVAALALLLIESFFRDGAPPKIGKSSVLAALRADRERAA